MKKKLKKKQKDSKKIKLLAAEKTEMFGLMGFIFALFLLDVNANMIGSYGQEIKVNLLFGSTIAATHMFWLGFLVVLFCFGLLATRSMYHPFRNRKRADLVVSIFGIIGLMIILSGGMMLFWISNNAIIPFFNWEITRISYYHIGISIEVLAAFYFGFVRS